MRNPRLQHGGKGGYTLASTTHEWWGGTLAHLGSVGVGASVGHGQHAGASVLEGEVLVGELVAVNGLAARAVVVGEVTALW